MRRTYKIFVTPGLLALVVGIGFNAMAASYEEAETLVTAPPVQASGGDTGSGPAGESIPHGRARHAGLVDWPPCSVAPAVAQVEVMNVIRFHCHEEIIQIKPGRIAGEGETDEVDGEWWIHDCHADGAGVSACAARGQDWKTDHDAGWEAYQAGRLDEAERRLKAAEKEARGVG